MRKKLLWICCLSLLATVMAPAADGLTIKDVTGRAFMPEYPASIQMLDDGETYASFNADYTQIIQYALKTGKPVKTLFDVSEAGWGDADDYLMSPKGDKMLIQTNTERIYRHSFKADFYVYDLKTKKISRLSEEGREQAPVWSPDGRYVAFVRDNNIFLADVGQSGAVTQVTTDGVKNEVINGIPDWVNEEEFGFDRAMVFNADATKLCWIRYDEAKVRTYSLQFYMMQADLYPADYSYKYPKAGETNATVTAWCYDIGQKKSAQLRVPLTPDGYMPRIVGTDKADQILVYTMNRHQDILTIVAADPNTMECRQLIEEKDKKYVKEEVLDGIKVTSRYIVMPSERDGFMQLYLYDRDGQLKGQLTHAKCGVTEVYGFDDKTATAYYQAAGRDPMNREVYASNLKKTVCITPKEGTNEAAFSKNYQFFIHTWSDRNTPFVFSVCNQQGKTLSVLGDNHALAAKVKQAGLPPKEFFSFSTASQVTLNGWMVKPADFDPGKKYPVVMFQYSGPGNQQVLNAWSIGSMGRGALFDQYLSQQGIIVVCVDGRGTGGRGADFEKCTYLNIGQLEAVDQVETALYLGSLPYIDAQRIAIWGWSYGGFNTLMSMTEGRPVFKAGVAVAPPTDWRFYDSIYTERYMRTPQENPTGYADNPITRAEKLHGALLICHGLADDNVHPQNTFELSEALVQADKDFKEVIYTNKNHSIYGGNTRTHLLRQIADFLIEQLKN